MVGTYSTDLPPGFRFHPTDEELIMFYLRNQATTRTCPVSIIPEVDIYKFDPWELPEKAGFGESEWYFFSPRDRKYPNGARPNRAAVSGYWKATGTDKVIYSGSKFVGVKKALVFYTGKPPKGVKTDWIMHEYRLNESRSLPNKHKGSMRLDDWVLCRIYKKKNLTRPPEQTVEESLAQIVTGDDVITEPQTHKFPRACSLTHLWEYEYMTSISQLLNENMYGGPLNDQETVVENGVEKHQQGQVQLIYTDPMKFQANQMQPIFVNPLSELAVHDIWQGPRNYNMVHDIFPVNNHSFENSLDEFLQIQLRPSHDKSHLHMIFPVILAKCNFTGYLRAVLPIDDTSDCS